MASKEDLLAAVAAAGTKGAEAYQAAQQSITAQQGQAVAAALRGAAGAPPEAQAQLSARVTSGYSGRQAQLTSDAATSGDYFAKLGANANVYADQTAQLIPAIQERARLAAAAKAASSSGSGSSGNDFTALAKQLGGYQNVKDYFTGQAKASGDPYAARALAIQSGVPDALAAQWYPYGSADEEFQTVGGQRLSQYAQKGWTPRQVKKDLRLSAAAFAGNQHPVTKQLVSQYRTLVGKKKK